MQSITARLFGLVLLTGAGALAQQPVTLSPAQTSVQQAPPTDPQLVQELEKRQHISDSTRFQLIQSLNAEFVRIRKILPVGDKSTILSVEGELKPSDARLHQLAMAYGAACHVGDRVKITNMAFKDKAVYLEINGGPKKKSKWYDHISVGMGGGGGMVGTPDPNQAQPTGAAITLEFKNHVPEMTIGELKQLLNPVFDFSVKSAAEVYLETLPPKVKEAITKHEVLVGMNRDMVIMAVERPSQKVREKDDKGEDCEEWIYGTPPKDVLFVRFKGDEVSQVKTMKVAGETVVKTEKEVDVKDGVASLVADSSNPNANGNATAAGPANSDENKAGQQQAAEQQPTHKPTLKREGEEPDPAVATAPSATTIPATSQRKPEPEWGSSGQQPPPQNQQKPPKE
ncbi:MAG TPA: hypothetical protein VHA33_07965 [Candidatus Angelobacter sp.]|jgi:hypothetical protein|nr:hypothetical protein [Candidatus Angelobacter sp.]